MKRKSTQVILLLLTVIIISPAAKAQSINEFKGEWDFKAPTAGYGYDAGVMAIEEQSVVTTFTGNSYEYPSDMVNYESDTLKFNFDVDGEYCECYLILEDDSHQKGYCKWPSGDTEVILTRKKAKE